MIISRVFSKHAKTLTLIIRRFEEPQWVKTTRESVPLG